MFIYHVQCKVMEPFVGSFATLYIIVEILLVYTYFASHVKQYITHMGLQFETTFDHVGCLRIKILRRKKISIV